jgi:hypothetical protein
LCLPIVFSFNFLSLDFPLLSLLFYNSSQSHSKYTYPSLPLPLSLSNTQLFMTLEISLNPRPLFMNQSLKFVLVLSPCGNLPHTRTHLTHQPVESKISGF